MTLSPPVKCATQSLSALTITQTILPVHISTYPTLLPTNDINSPHYSLSSPSTCRHAPQTKGPLLPSETCVYRTDITLPPLRRAILINTKVVTRPP